MILIRKQRTCNRRRMIDIVAQAHALRRAVDIFISHARGYYYEVVLSGVACPNCKGALEMLFDGLCRCRCCGHEFDPTVAFQKCRCGGQVRLNICRYQCVRCKDTIRSRFVFGATVLDKEYFKERMAQSRQRKQARRQKIIETLAENRSPPLENDDYIDLNAVDGLSDALDELTQVPELSGLLPLCKGFDLTRYQQHLEAAVGFDEVCFDDIQPLEEDGRLDRIWRFVAVIFMAHLGTMRLHQADGVIYLKKAK